MKNYWILAFVFLIVISCKSKRTTLTDDQTVSSEEFIDFFPEMQLPYSIADTTLTKKSNDSALIGYKVFTQIVGDTVLKKQFGTKARPRIYPIGRVPVKKAETYVFVKAVTPEKRGVYLLTFDKENIFKAALPLLVLDTDPQTSQTAGMDSRFTISMNRQRRKPDGTAVYRREAYVYNNVGVYTLILTESNEDLATTGDVVNPLDTFSKKNKYSGDYIKDKRNIVAIRDGKNAKTMRFFVHFEKDKGTCRGEVRGEATFVEPNLAVYRESGDPCVLQFAFTANSVSMKELEGCGNYRDIKCFFEGSFPRKKEVKPKKK
ncbi:MAG TPA: hypothetical protein VGD17_05350 [Chitinophagaceae bacterium]